MSEIAKILITLFLVTLTATMALHCDRLPKNEVEVRVDTVVVSEVRVDTVVVKEIVERKREIRDTIYVPCEGEDSVALEVVSKEYADSLYRAVISGVEPLNLDTMEVYPRTRTIYREIEKKVYEYDRFPLYAVASFNGISRRLYPSMGVYTIHDRKWLYGAEIGFYDDFSPYYSVKIGIKFK